MSYFIQDTPYLSGCPHIFRKCFYSRKPVICTNLAGKEVLHKTMHKDTPLGTLRAAVQVALCDGTEKRMARDGWFYTQEEFLTEDPSSGQLSWAVAPAQFGSKLLADAELLMDDSQRLSELSKKA